MLDYAEHTRLRAGTAETMAIEAVRGYLSDTLAGHRSLLIVGTNTEAGQLSGEIRARLIALGRVDPAPLAVLRDGTLAGIGDVVAARRNDWTIEFTGPGRQVGVINRETYTILAPAPGAGGLVVAREDGATAHLPADYVAEHLTLGYAVTVHAAQGATVDTAHALLGEGAHREQAYVALTRGRQSNTAYLISHRAPDEHHPEALAETAVARLATIIENPGAHPAAQLIARDTERESQSLSWVVAHWDTVVTEYAADRYTDILTGLLPATDMDRLVGEPGYRRLMRAVRAGELAGHNPTPLLTEAATLRGLGDACSLADVLRWRLHHNTNHSPEHRPDPTDWASWTPPMPGPIGAYIHDLATVATQRQSALGAATAVQQPDWAVFALGPVPGQTEDRRRWERAAGILAGYRELAALPEQRLDLGGEPTGEQVLHRTLWHHAHQTVAAPAEASGFSDEELREIASQWWRSAAQHSGGTTALQADGVAARHPEGTTADAGLGADQLRQRAWLATAELTRRGHRLAAADLQTDPTVSDTDAGQRNDPPVEVAIGAAPEPVGPLDVNSATAVQSADTERARHEHIMAKLAGMRQRLRERAAHTQIGSQQIRCPGYEAEQADADWYAETTYTADTGLDHDLDADQDLGW